MASAEKLLNEAQYSFQNIGFDDSSDSRKNRSRAKSLAHKILRKYPGTSEAASAHALLLRLDATGYTPTKNVHTHSKSPQNNHQHHKLRTPVAKNSSNSQTMPGNDVQLRWGDLIAKIFALPKPALFVLFVVGMFLFGVFGPFILIPAVILILLGSPLKRAFPNKTQRNSDEFVRKINAWLLEEKKRTVSRQ